LPVIVTVDKLLLRRISEQFVNSDDRFKVRPSIFPEAGNIHVVEVAGIDGIKARLTTGIPYRLADAPVCWKEKSIL